MALTAALLGLAIGLALGMLGGGGSVLAVPVLVYLLGQDVHRATTASLLVVATAALAGGLGHARLGRVCWRHAAAFTAPALGGILVGTAANHAVGGNLLLVLFAAVMLVAAWATWRKAGGDDDETGAPRPSAQARPPLRPARDVAAGAGVGLLTGFFGVGGGFVVVPALAIALGFPMRSAIGTSLVIVSVVSVLGLAVHLLSGNGLDLSVTAAMAAACALGALAGAHAAPHVSHQTLGRAFALLVVAVAAYLVLATAFLGGAPEG